MADERTDPQYKLRFPEELRDLIAEAARANSRSMNAEIVARLQSTFSETRSTGTSHVAPMIASEVALLSQEIVDGIFNRLSERTADSLNEAKRQSLLKRLASVGFVEKRSDTTDSPLLTVEDDLSTLETRIAETAAMLQREARLRSKIAPNSQSSTMTNQDVGYSAGEKSHLIAGAIAAASSYATGFPVTRIPSDEQLRTDGAWLLGQDTPDFVLEAFVRAAKLSMAHSLELYKKIAPNVERPAKRA